MGLIHKKKSKYDWQQDLTKTHPTLSMEYNIPSNKAYVVMQFKIS